MPGRLTCVISAVLAVLAVAVVTGLTELAARDPFAVSGPPPTPDGLRGGLPSASPLPDSAGHTRTPSPDHTAASPRSTPATRVPEVAGSSRAAKEVALTFDDGPGRNTSDVLRVLQRERVPATFFMLGQNVTERPDDVRQLAAAEMSVQSHTWSHDDLTRMSPRRVDAQLNRTADAIERVAGTRPGCVRPPFGATDRLVHQRAARAGQVPVNWDVDPDDWRQPGAGKIVRRVVSAVHPGAIVLLHDGGGTRTQTVAALPKIIEELRDRGYRFTALCQR